MNKHKIRQTSQSGFRKNHSCNTALINKPTWQMAETYRQRWINWSCVFFDLRKAFDVVDHDLLIKKLAAYKFSENSLSWIKTYITDRKQCIVAIYFKVVHTNCQIRGSSRIGFGPSSLPFIYKQHAFISAGRFVEIWAAVCSFG